jgi:error-prone DNA polymerase
MQASYGELHCLSNYSFLKAASHPQELVERAFTLGYSALALTDECSVAGVVRAHVAAKKLGFKLLIGSELTLDDGLRLVLLATDRDGYGNLCELITQARRAAKKGSYLVRRTDLDGGIAGCLALLIPDTRQLVSVEADAIWLKRQFAGRCWIALELHRSVNDARTLAMLRQTSAHCGVPLVAAGGVLMHQRSRKPLHDVLSAIRFGQPVASLGRQLLPNGERHLRTLARLCAVYPPECLTETLEVARRCTFSLDEIRYQYPDEVVPAGATPASHLRQLTEQGLLYRYPNGTPEQVRRTVEYELALIGELRYEPYFLTVHDVVAFARSRNILCQGRGSAANSAVCYCLGITEVDPDRMQVLFERFISKERNEPPDIDVDFEHERREEVIQYLYQKYGRERTALTAALITYRPKSAMRDAGKALGLSLDQVDRLAKSLVWWDSHLIQPQRIIEAGFRPDHPLIAKLVEFAHLLVGFPRHLSQHTGGFVIAQGKLSRLVPIENAAMPNRTVIQWDKDDLDALGLLKVDVLALGMLSAIRKTIDLVNGYRNTALTMAAIPAEDPRVYDMLCKADTIGVFQIESRAQMSMLPRLKPRCFYDLVVEVAIVRPGPIMGDMVHPYLRRRNGEEEVTYPRHAGKDMLPHTAGIPFSQGQMTVEGVLERTLGIPIFQEQVMQLAIVAAGFTPGEADQLRRAMAAWKRKGGLEPFRDKLLAGMLARGYAAEFAERLFEQIKGFGDYGFPESHAASFALLVYISSWLKFHEPAAFAAALINSQPMGFYSASQIVQDAKRHHVEVRAIDVAASDWDCILQPGKGEERRPALRLGLRMVKGLSRDGAQRLLAAREQQPFADIGDLAARGVLSKEDLNALAGADALRSIAGHRRSALWQTLGTEKQAQNALMLPSMETPQRDLFERPAEGEDILQDYATTGLSLRRHPLALLRPQLSRRRLVPASVVAIAQHCQLIRTTGIVTGRQSPETAHGTIFVTLEDETGMINVVVWPRLAERQRKELLTSRLLTVYGKVERQGQIVHVVAGRLRDDSLLLGGLTTRSRNFK